jgi:hypothetical protein
VAPIGLWKLAEEVFARIEKLHAERSCHSDLELHNIVFCMLPIQTFLANFESSERAFSVLETTWAAARVIYSSCYDLPFTCKPGLEVNKGCSLGNRWWELLRYNIKNRSNFVLRVTGIYHKNVVLCFNDFIPSNGVASAHGEKP